MHWVILLISFASAGAALQAASNTRNLKAMILRLEQDKRDIQADIEFNRSKLDELLDELFKLRMEVRGVPLPD